MSAFSLTFGDVAENHKGIQKYKFIYYKHLL